MSSSLKSLIPSLHQYPTPTSHTFPYPTYPLRAPVTPARPGSRVFAQARSESTRRVGPGHRAAPDHELDTARYLLTHLRGPRHCESLARIFSRGLMDYLYSPFGRITPGSQVWRPLPLPTLPLTPHPERLIIVPAPGCAPTPPVDSGASLILNE